MTTLMMLQMMTGRHDDPSHLLGGNPHSLRTDHDNFLPWGDGLWQYRRAIRINRQSR